jgi:prolipoprotein diacylglyceryltransferase
LFFVVLGVDIIAAALVLADASGRVEPFAEGELMGRAVEKSIIPLVLSAILGNWFRKKYAG